ncbi:hypothetical protein CsSME_00046694 [Camellia sinensis var. sinensis]
MTYLRSITLHHQPIAPLKDILSPPSREKHIKQKVQREHHLTNFQYPDLSGQKKEKERAKDQSQTVHIVQDVAKQPQTKHPTKSKKLTLTNKMKVWTNMSKLNKQKVQNLHKNDSNELLVWRGDSKSRNMYFDDIIHIIKEESIHNSVIDVYSEILLEL